MNFNNINYSYIFFISIVFFLIIVSFFYVYISKKKFLKNFSLKQLHILYPFSINKLKIKILLFILAIILILISLLDPYIIKQEIVEQNNDRLNVMICLDISRSMLAEDILPNRLEKAKHEIVSILRAIPDAYFSVLAFTADGKILSPFTPDITSIRNIISTIQPTFFSKQGTDIENAFKLIYDNFQDVKNMVVILISDGEDHSNLTTTYLDRFSKEDIKVYTLGIGSDVGAPIPIYDNNQKYFLRDKDDNPVISKLNKSILSNIANTTNGKYYFLEIDTSFSNSLSKEILNTSQEEQIIKVYLYKYFLYTGLFLLILAFIINTKIHSVFILFLFFSFSYASLFNFSEWRNNIKGNQALENLDIEKSKQYYLNALKNDPTNEVNRYNLGNIYALQGEKEKAIQEWSMINDKNKLSDVYYNKAVLDYLNNDYNDAVNNLVNTLMLNPEDDDAKINLEMLLSLLNQQLPQQNHKSNDEDEKQDKEENNQHQSSTDEQAKQNEETQEEKDFSKDEAEDIIESLASPRVLDTLDEKDKQEEKDNPYVW
jgi:tetratricopeptide (TPR) repeat protein